MNCVVQNTCSEERFQGSPIHDVTGTFEEFVDVQFHPGVLKDAHRPIRVEIHQHINVAFRAGAPNVSRIDPMAALRHE
jgi:hypothetical protein